MFLFADQPTGIYALTLPPNATWNETGLTVAGNWNGSAGDDLGSLNTPVSIFVDNNYVLYVTDRENHRILKYYSNSTIGTVVAGNGTAGSDSSQLNEPKGVAVDQTGAVIVADSLNYRILRFVPGSTVGTIIATNTSSFVLGHTRDLQIDVNNNVYVTDSDFSRVLMYSAHTGLGSIVVGSNGTGTGAAQLNVPFGTYISGNNTLFIADSSNNRIQMWPPGATSGTTVAGITGTSGSALNQLSRPYAVINDNNG